MHDVAIVGSNNKISLNRRLATAIAKRYGTDDVTINVLTLNDLPMYNVDDELTPAQVVIDFKQAIEAADGVIWVTPEYTPSIPGVLKNAID